MRIILIYLFRLFRYNSRMVKNSEKILADHNVSITNPRVFVLEVLLENKGPITLDELQSTLKNKVAKSTLYRVLNDLKKINILDEFTSPENQTVVELSLSENDHHHHVFCTNCGEVEDITLSEVFEKQLSDEITNIHKTSKYRIKEHTLELIGLCSDCD